MAADFDKPTVYTEYSVILDQIKDNVNSSAKMDGSGSNLPTGYVQYDTDNVFKRWDGLAFNPAVLSEAGGGTGRTDGTVARADSADSADSVEWDDIENKPAVIAAGATEQAARESVGINNAMIADQASISSSSSTGSVTTTHFRQVNASGGATASGIYSQVNASGNSTASATYSQVNASTGSTATGPNSQVNASGSSTAAASRSQVICSLYVRNITENSLALGYASSGEAAVANQKIRLEADIGIGRFKGNTTTGGFDYAEYFPNLTQEIIPVGTIVTLDGDKIKPAAANDFILGVVSETYGVLGNSADFCWHGRELRNEFGGVIKHDVEMVRWTNELSTYDGRVADAVDIPDDATYYTVNVPMENPDYVDQGSDYVDRSERKDEWSIIGLMGQVYVRVYTDIPNNTFVSAGGTPSSTETNLYCMTMTTPYDSEKGYGVAKCLIR